MDNLTQGRPESNLPIRRAKLVYREDKLTLWHFSGEKKPTARTPLLIVTPWSTRPGWSTCRKIAPW